MSLRARRELTATVASRYVVASRSGKRQMLDEFVLSAGYNRKYAIRLLSETVLNPANKGQRVRRVRRRKYGPEVEQALISLWRHSGGLCSKRLVPFLCDFIAALERFDEICLSPEVKEKLFAMSVSTADRRLRAARRQGERGIGTTSPGTLLRHQIPIRTYEDWTENRPGFAEVDLVAHCGGTAAGEYCYTLTVTDICTGWTECESLLNRSQAAVVSAMKRIRKRLPFELLGIDSDNGSEFINHLLKDWCDGNAITFTRCRPYKKNDQCHVEQKNGAVVRPLVGYARYEGAAAGAHLSKLYLTHRLCVNYFEPSMKLTGKTRSGARVKKTYDKAKTPWQRLESVLSQQEDMQERIAALQAFYLSLNPAKLRRRLYDLAMELPRFTVGQTYPDWIAPPNACRNVTLQKGDRHAQDA